MNPLKLEISRRQLLQAMGAVAGGSLIDQSAPRLQSADYVPNVDDQHEIMHLQPQEEIRFLWDENPYVVEHDRRSRTALVDTSRGDELTVHMPPHVSKLLAKDPDYIKQLMFLPFSASVHQEEVRHNDPRFSPTVRIQRDRSEGIAVVRYSSGDEDGWYRNGISIPQIVYVLLNERIPVSPIVSEVSEYGLRVHVHPFIYSTQQHPNPFWVTEGDERLCTINGQFVTLSRDLLYSTGLIDFDQPITKDGLVTFPGFDIDIFKMRTTFELHRLSRPKEGYNIFTVHPPHIQDWGPGSLLIKE